MPAAIVVLALSVITAADIVAVQVKRIATDGLKVQVEHDGSLHIGGSLSLESIYGLAR